MEDSLRPFWKEKVSKPSIGVPAKAVLGMKNQPERQWKSPSRPFWNEKIAKPSIGEPAKAVLERKSIQTVNRSPRQGRFGKKKYPNRQ